MEIVIGLTVIAVVIGAALFARHKIKGGNGTGGGGRSGADKH